MGLAFTALCFVRGPRGCPHPTSGLQPLAGKRVPEPSGVGVPSPKREASLIPPEGSEQSPASPPVHPAPGKSGLSKSLELARPGPQRLPAANGD